jgi:ketosteroid isomerase-like protein
MSTEALEERLDRIESELRTLRDREAIRDVLYRYCRAVDRLDLALLKSCYHEDAYDAHWFFNGNAHDFADYVIGEVLPGCVASEHAISNPIIELDGDRAFCESRVTVLHRLALGDRPEQLDQVWHCRYVDLFERRGGEWRISYRHVVADGGREFEVPDLLSLQPPDALGRHGSDDAVYARFDLERLRPGPERFDDFWAPFLAMHGVTNGAAVEG